MGISVAVAVVGTAAAAVAAATDAPVVKTVAARTMTMLPVATAVQAG